jgi:hypothetical protein
MNFGISWLSRLSFREQLIATSEENAFPSLQPSLFIRFIPTGVGNRFRSPGVSGVSTVHPQVVGNDVHGKSNHQNAPIQSHGLAEHFNQV